MNWLYQWHKRMFFLSLTIYYEFCVKPWSWHSAAPGHKSILMLHLFHLSVGIILVGAPWQWCECETVSCLHVPKRGMEIKIRVSKTRLQSESAMNNQSPISTFSIEFTANLMKLFHFDVRTLGGNARGQLCTVGWLLIDIKDLVITYINDIPESEMQNSG